MFFWRGHDFLYVGTRGTLATPGETVQLARIIDSRIMQTLRAAGAVFQAGDLRVMQVGMYRGT
jgi:hypothetical protein